MLANIFKIDIITHWKILTRERIKFVIYTDKKYWYKKETFSQSYYKL